VAKVKLAEFYEKWQHYKSLGADGIRQLQTLKPKKSEYGDKSITEYTAVVIEEKEEVLSILKNKNAEIPAINKPAPTARVPSGRGTRLLSDDCVDVGEIESD
jgi:hypothetical protein